MRNTPTPPPGIPAALQADNEPYNVHIARTARYRKVQDYVDTARSTRIGGSRVGQEDHASPKTRDHGTACARNNRARPEPGLADHWMERRRDDTGLDYYDKSSIRRYGDLVGVGVRSELSDAPIEEAREMASVPSAGTRGIIMEKTFLYLLADCKEKVFRPPDVRLFTAGKLVLESRYEGENLTNWRRIKPIDEMERELRTSVC